MFQNIVFKNFLRLILLLTLQILILNNVYLTGWVAPMLFVLFVLMLPTQTPRNLMLLIAFVVGLVVDISSNVLGPCAAACTLVAFCRITFADRILTRGEDVVVGTPSIHSVGFQSFSVYSLLLLTIFFLLYFLLMIFSLHDLGHILLSTVASTGVTWLLVVLYQWMFLHSERDAKRERISH